MAGIIRGEKFTSSSAFSFERLEDKARGLLEEARAEAAKIRAEAEEQGRRRAEELLAAARPEGFEQGRREAFEKARAEAQRVTRDEARNTYAKLSQSLSQALTDFEASKRRMLALAENGVIELALALARRVCKYAAGRSSDVALGNVAALLEMVKHEQDAVLHLNPRDVETAKAALPELLATIQHCEHVEIVADESVTRGGCVLQSRSGTIDATLETQLDRVAEALMGGAVSPKP